MSSLRDVCALLRSSFRFVNMYTYAQALNRRKKSLAGHGLKKKRKDGYACRDRNAVVASNAGVLSVARIQTTFPCRRQSAKMNGPIRGDNTSNNLFAHTARH